MRNPDKFLREGYLTALQAQGLTVYNKTIPVDTTPDPTGYVLVESQSKSTTERSKTDFEWNSRITLHIIKVNTRGYSATSMVDDMEEKCINAVESGILVNNFYLKSTYLVESMNLDMSDKTNTIERRILIYEHWLAEKPQANNGFNYTLPFVLS